MRRINLEIVSLLTVLAVWNPAAQAGAFGIRLNPVKSQNVGNDGTVSDKAETVPGTAKHAAVVGPEKEGTNPWIYAGYYGGGQYPALVPDPNVEGRIYLGSDVAGMWRSDDRGDHWHFINKGLDSLNIACIAVAPSDSNVVYAGTQTGVMRSGDAGQSWEKRSTKDLDFSRPQSQKAIMVDPSDPEKIYAGSSKGKVFASADGGRSWDEIGNTKDVYGEKEIINFVLLTRDGKKLFAGSKAGLMAYSFDSRKWDKADPAGPKTAYIDGVLSKSGMLFVTSGKRFFWSGDNGSSWNASSEIKQQNLFRIAVHEAADGTLQILAGWSQGWSGGPLYSGDMGKTWTAQTPSYKAANDLNPTRSWIGGGLQRSNALTFDPFNPDILYHSDGWGVWRSDDAGKSWHEIIDGAPNMTGEDLALAEDGTLLVGTMDDGLLASTDGGSTYKAVLPVRGREAAYVSGHYWRVLPLGGGSYVTAASPWYDRKNAVFTGDYVSGEYKKIKNDQIAHFSYRNTFWGVGYPRALAKDPKNSSLLYLGIDGDEAGGFYYSEDGGETWQYPKEQPVYRKVYNGLDTDPETGRIIWAACGVRGGIYTLDKPGEKWDERFFGGGACFFDLKAAAGGIAYAGGNTPKGPALYVSRDHAEHWDVLYRFDQGQAVEAIAVDPSKPDNLFAGLVNWGCRTGGRIMHSADGGKAWEDITAGLPENSGPAAMLVNPKDGMLYMLLYAGGIYKRPLDSIYGTGS